MPMLKYEDMNSMEIDALREIGSIGTGSAATALSGMLGTEVRMTLPEVQILEFNDAVEKMGGFETVAAGVMSMISGQINGVMLAIFHMNAVNLLLNSMLSEDVQDYTQLTELDRSALVEVGNILISAFINALSGLSGIEIKLSVPAFTVDMQGAMITVPMAAVGSQSNHILFIGGQFIVHKETVPCRILLSPDMRSLNYILEKLGLKHE